MRRKFLLPNALWPIGANQAVAALLRDGLKAAGVLRPAEIKTMKKPNLIAPPLGLNTTAITVCRPKGDAAGINFQLKLT
jgi:hypothetical protein